LNPCPFCSITPDRAWIETEHTITFADAEPIADGHKIVAPRKHVCTIHQFSISEQKAVWNLVAEVRERLLTGPSQMDSRSASATGCKQVSPNCTPTCTWSRAGPAIRLNPVPESSG